MAVYTAIDDAGSYFSPTLYVGDEASHAITGVGFQPDVVWLKDRDYAYNQIVTDAVRGATKNIYPNGAYPEDTDAQGVKTFDTDGFTVGTTQSYNKTGDDFVSWSWKAGTTSGIATNGSTTITPSSYSFDQTAGISIIKYVGNLTGGAKLAHGLGATPTFVMVKMLNDTKDWLVYSKGMDATAPEDYGMSLNTADARVDELTFWNDTAPDSVNFTLGNTVKVNGDGDDYIAYCFTDIQGFNRFGSFIGNGNADGTFVYTGFRPAFVMIKCASRAGTDIWTMFDSKRLGYNVDNNALGADTDAVERTSDDIDFLSNGFKLRNTVTDVNPSGETAIYIAFAQAPLVNSSGVPVNAR